MSVCSSPLARRSVAIAASGNVKGVLGRLFQQQGAPRCPQSDTGPEFLAKLLRT